MITITIVTVVTVMVKCGKTFRSIISLPPPTTPDGCLSSTATGGKRDAIEIESEKFLSDF
jgi:hypothetical protein